MAGGVKQLQKGDILFRENDPSDCMYVIRKGRIAITKTKGTSDIKLAELGAGEMLGEMAFFDNRPRSAGAKAMESTEVISLPFAALHAQFKTFPEWLKSMVKTVNSHLRSANQRIKNLEQVSKGDEEVFPPPVITRLTAIISLMGFKLGKEEEGVGLVIPTYTLRNYCIQIFQQPTHKMNKLIEVLSGLGIMKTEDLGEGQIKTIILKHELLTQFVDWYNNWLFAKDADRVLVEEKELPVIKALLYYGKTAPKGDDGNVTVSLTKMQNDSMKDLNYLVNVDAANSLADKGVIGDKVSGENAELSTSFKLEDLQKIYPFWELIYVLKNYK